MHTPLEPVDALAARWRSARRAALHAVLHDVVVLQSVAEGELLARALERDAVDAQRRVFDNSLRLGQGFLRFHRETVELPRLPAVLAQLGAEGAPCLRGDWTGAGQGDAMRLERRGCALAAAGPAACDWWREAISGLVLGLTDGVGHARHESLGHGDPRCVDVVHAGTQHPLRFGPLPAPVREALAQAAATVARFDSSFAVQFLGLSEGVLYYQLASAACGGTLNARPIVERAVHRRLPELALREVSPRPVLGDP